MSVCTAGVTCVLDFLFCKTKPAKGFGLGFGGPEWGLRGGGVGALMDMLVAFVFGGWEGGWGPTDMIVSFVAAGGRDVGGMMGGGGVALIDLSGAFVLGGWECVSYYDVRRLETKGDQGCQFTL